MIDLLIGKGISLHSTPNCTQQFLKTSLSHMHCLAAIFKHRRVLAVSNFLKVNLGSCVTHGMMTQKEMGRCALDEANCSLPVFNLDWNEFQPIHRHRFTLCLYPLSGNCQLSNLRSYCTNRNQMTCTIKYGLSFKHRTVQLEAFIATFLKLSRPLEKVIKKRWLWRKGFFFSPPKKIPIKRKKEKNPHYNFLSITSLFSLSTD